MLLFWSLFVHFAYKCRLRHLPFIYLAHSFHCGTHARTQTHTHTHTHHARTHAHTHTHTYTHTHSHTHTRTHTLLVTMTPMHTKQSEARMLASYYPGQKLLQPRYSWDCYAVRSCDVMRHRLQSAVQRKLPTRSYRESRRLSNQKSTSTYMISHDQTVDQPMNFPAVTISFWPG